MKYACPCCGYLTFGEMPIGTFNICPVCFWEDDLVQKKDPEYAGGANEVSLNKAKANFLKFGSSTEDHLLNVRKARPEEIPK